MKNFALSATSLAIVGLVIYILFLQQCRRKPDPCPPDGYVLISEDSLAVFQATIEYLKEHPDTVVSIRIVKWDPVLVESDIPDPVQEPPDLNHYKDSLVNDDINVWVDILARGMIVDWKWQYLPITREIDRYIDRPVPVIVPQEKKVLVNEREIFLGLQTGGSQEQFMFGVELTYHNRKHNYYGIGASRFGEFNIYEFKFGTRILHW